VPFFDERPPPKPRKRSRRLRRDEYGRPTLILPGYLGEDLVLARSDRVAVLMHGIACYAAGFAFTLEATNRYAVDDEDDRWDVEPFGLWGRRRQSPARFGIEYSDGSRVTLDDERFPGPSGREGAPIAIVRGGGSGGGGHYSSELWVQPLPPPGPVKFAVEWHSEGIEETLQTIEGQRFVDAAKRAQRVFPARKGS
jgi:hypothetical protein